MPGSERILLGTAVFIAGNLALTARHVLDGTIARFGAKPGINANEFHDLAYYAINLMSLCSIGNLALPHSFMYWQSLPTMLGSGEHLDHEKERIMPTRNVNLTEELDRFVLTKVRSGRYENASEVVRAALRMLEREEEQYEAQLAALRSAIDEGDASGLAEGDVFAHVRQTLNLPAPR